MALDLIVKLDIDVHVLVQEGTDLLRVTDRIYHDLLDREHVHEVRISDYREESAVKIGIDKYPGVSGDWSIDLWVTDRLEKAAFEYVNHLREMLRPGHRKAILHIKSHYHSRGQLRDGMSTLIYEAVMDNGVRTIDEFEQFLSTRARPK